MASFPNPPIGSPFLDANQNMTTVWSTWFVRLKSWVTGESPTTNVAPADARYIIQQPSEALTVSQDLASLATGFVKNTAGSGVLTTVPIIGTSELDETGVVAQQYFIGTQFFMDVDANGRIQNALTAVLQPEDVQLPNITNTSIKNNSGNDILSWDVTDTNPLGVTLDIGSVNLFKTDATYIGFSSTLRNTVCYFGPVGGTFPDERSGLTFVGSLGGTTSLVGPNVAATDYAFVLPTTQGATNDVLTMLDNSGTIGFSSHPNSFSTIAVSGQSDVVADSTTDTLTLVAGSNITLTTNAGSDTITIASTGGSSYTNEEAQDAVGTILTDTATIDFTYSDVTPSITADVKSGSITNAMLAGSIDLTTKVAGVLPIASGGSGVASSDPLIQRVSTQTGTVATGTTTVPFDNTTPQNTEGDQYMSLAITPKNTANILTISVTVHVTSSVNNNICVALFQDSTANALASALVVSNAGFTVPCTFRYSMAAGTTSATTFKVRAGGSVAGTTTFNGSGGTQVFNGTFASRIDIIETST